MTRKQANQPQFEQMIAELSSIVQQLEQGDLALDDALQQFERGILLARQSQQQLSAAEQKVQILLQQHNGEGQLMAFEPERGE